MTQALQQIRNGATLDEVALGNGYDSHSGLLYITTELAQSISIVDPKTLKIVGTVPTGQPESHMLALSHDGKRGYTANVGPGTVSVLDMQARKTLLSRPVRRSETTL